METPQRKRKTCDELRQSLRKIGRKVSGNKAELEERLEEVYHKNDRGWVKHCGAVLGSYKYLASGAHRHVYMGIYQKGPRKGLIGVKKVFKSGSVHSNKFFEEDIQAIGTTGEIIKAFNASREGLRVRLNEAEVWQNLEPDEIGRFEKALVEPLIEEKYHKFNSNTGFQMDGYKTMQALSHFSYHVTDGRRLLCDLQGGFFGDHYVLTDPVICSVDRKYGVTDLGPEGIQNFFHYHVCSQYCSTRWSKPRAVRHFSAVPGTTFGSAANSELDLTVPLLLGSCSTWGCVDS